MTGPKKKPDRSSVVTTRRDRLFRVAVALAGMLLCIQVFFEDREVAGSPQFANEALERVRLGPSDGFKILSETSIERRWLYQVENFKRWFDNRHIWAHWQSLRYKDTVGAVYYFEFRNEEDARAAKESLKTEHEAGWPRAVEAFETFAVVVSAAPEDLAVFKAAVFAAVEGKFRIAGGSEPCENGREPRLSPKGETSSATRVHPPDGLKPALRTGATLIRYSAARS